MRLYELAKELKMVSKELMGKLNTDGYTYKNRLNSVAPNAVDKMRTLYGPLPGRPKRKTEPRKKKPPREKPDRKDKKDRKKPAAKDKGKPVKPLAKTGQISSTVRKIADIPASITKDADGKIKLPSAFAKSVKKKSVALPPHQKIKTPRKPKQKKKPATTIKAPKIGTGKAADTAKADYSKLEKVGIDDKKDKTPQVKPEDRETKRRRKVDWFGGKEVRVIVPSRRGRERGRSHGVIVRRKGKSRGGPRAAAHKGAPVEFKRPDKLELVFPVSIRDLSSKLGIKATDIIKKLIMQGTMVTINSYLDEDSALTIGLEYGTEIEAKKEKVLADEITEIDEFVDKPEDLVPRAPVVAFLGHVDHGKTSLLDHIRKTTVQEKEHGGITQNFTAWTIDHEGSHVVFLDTPGHEAFTEMRARGANITDIVVLVVAVDDGVMPQTEEAINHAKAADVPIVVALNKIDKPNANLMKTKQQLAGHGLNPPEWGGKTEMVETSATVGTGMDALLEALSAEAEIMELKANPKRPATGTVLEAELTAGRGVVARMLIQNGTLKKGDVLLAGSGFGKVRDIIDARGNSLDAVGPSQAVEVSGLDAVPAAGDRFYVLADIHKARLLAEEKKKNLRESNLAEKRHVTLENIFSTIEAEAAKEVRLVIKADVMGSIEVLTKAVIDLSTNEVKVKVIHSAVGAVNESDVLLADASEAIVFAFMMTADDKARILAENKGVDIRYHTVIYELITELESAMEGLLDPEEVEEVIGTLEIRDTFHASRIGTIAGCFVKRGRIERSDRVRLIRDGAIIYTSTLDSLRRFKEDVREVKEGYECGVKIKGYNDVKVGDSIEVFIVKKVARTLESTK